MEISKSRTTRSTTTQLSLIRVSASLAPWMRLRMRILRFSWWMTRGSLTIRKNYSFFLKCRKVVARAEFSLASLANTMFISPREIPVNKKGSDEAYCRIRLSVQYITPNHTFYTPPNVNVDNLIPKYFMLTVNEANLVVWSIKVHSYFLEFKMAGKRGVFLLVLWWCAPWEESTYRDHKYETIFKFVFIDPWNSRLIVDASKVLENSRIYIVLYYGKDHYIGECSIKSDDAFTVDETEFTSEVRNPTIFLFHFQPLS